MVGICRSSKRAAALVVVAIALTGVPRASSAAPRPGKPTAPPSLGDSLSGAAREDYDAARLLFGHDDFAAAAIKFGSAYERSKDARLLWNIASCEQKLKRYARARTVLERYLEEGGSALSEQDRRDADAVLKTIAPFVTSLKLTAQPDEAEIVVDGEVVAKSPVAKSLYVELGKHELVIRRDGYRPNARTINGSGGDTLYVTVKLEPAPHEGQLDVRAGRDDMISLDGQALGIGSVTKTIASGSHTLRITSSGQPTREMEIVIEDDKQKTIDLRASNSGSSATSTWILAGSGIAIGTAALAVGAFFLFRGSSASGVPNQPGTLGAVDLR